MKKDTLEECLEKFKKVHGNKYDYSLVNYINSNINVIIICNIKEHPNFPQTPHQHKRGSGCSYCNGNKKLEIEHIKDYKKTHGNLYNYNNVIYKGNHKNIEIICSKHKSFWQTSAAHKEGAGCPKCNLKKGPQKILNILENKNINYDIEYKFDDFKKFSFDFYIKDYNLVIEFDGRQHFEVVEYFGGKKGLRKTQQRDELKNQYCKDNDINLLRISYLDIKNINKIINKEI